MSESKKKLSTKAKIGIGAGACGLILVLWIVLTVTLAPKIIKEQSTSKSSKPTSTNTSNINTTTEPAKAQFVFDVPSLVGKNIDEVRQVLGQPTEAQKSLGGFNEWDNTFKKDNEELLVTFNYQTRKIIDFFISTTNQDKNRLLQIGNLKENSPDYKIEYVKAIKDPSKITGVKIIPAK